MRPDLAWWRNILHHPAPPRILRRLPELDIVVSTDASDAGLCALVPTLQLALTYRFTAAERRQIEGFKQRVPNAFDINYRELLACAFVIHAWAPTLRTARPQSRPLHVHFRVDNTSVIAWQSKMTSRNSRAQVIIPLIRLWGLQFGLRLSALHIPSVENEAADAGSRCWENDAYAHCFDEITRDWQSSPPPTSIADLETAWRNISASIPSPSPRLRSTRAHPTGENSGSRSRQQRTRSLSGSPSRRPTSRPSIPLGHPRLIKRIHDSMHPTERLKDQPGSLKSSPLFIHKDGRPSCMTAARVTRVILDGAREIGEGPDHFSTHSLRADGTTNMYQAGVDALAIQFHDRWASDAFKLYTRRCQASVAGAARMISVPRAFSTLAYGIVSTTLLGGGSARTVPAGLQRGIHKI